MSSVSEYKPLIGATGGGLATRQDLVATFELRRFCCPVMKFVHCHRLRKMQEGHMMCVTSNMNGIELLPLFAVHDSVSLGIATGWFPLRRIEGLPVGFRGDGGSSSYPKHS